MNDKMTLLYIDDELINVELFELNFNKKFNVITGLSGLDGLNILESNPEISLVISDLKMPLMSGLEFIRIAKKKYPNTTFFIITGFDITEEIAKAIDEKIIHKYFQKPVKVKEIENTIENLSLSKSINF